MSSLIKRILRKAVLLKNSIIPSSIRIRADAELFSITQFIKFAAREIKPSEKILDAGAGSSPYKKYFSHAKYESTDFKDIFDKSAKGKHDFVCSLDRIPKKDNTYDSIICTQVLEHVEFPQKVINEFHRILKPDGKLFLTAPQGWGIHGEPYNFFNFTKYGLQSLFTHAGFKIVFIRPRGGIFWYLGKRVKTLSSYIMAQYLLEKKNDSIRIKPKAFAFVLAPFYILFLPFCSFFIPLLFFYLDKLDRKQDYTLGYACYCVKK